MTSNRDSVGDTWNQGSGTDWNENGAVNGVNDNFGFTDSAGVGPADNHAGGANGACRNCGQDGHFARECPEPRKLGLCFNCGEEGHSKAECTKPRVFTGTCNVCSEVGHRAADCPAKPKFCLRCKVEGDHDTKDCTNNFYIDLTDVPDYPEGAAWGMIMQANSEDDLDDFKEALRILQKAAPELTYQAIEKKLRSMDSKFYLIALKKESGDAHTFVDLQGIPGKTFCVAIFKSPNCQRPNMAGKWPASQEENMLRLADAGTAFELHVPFCRTCEKYGHFTRECEQERVPIEGPQIQCALCGEVGHRVRDCKEPRKKERKPMECRVCGGEHMAKDCDQKPVIKCRNCDQEGHKATDCAEPRVMRCRNCNEAGHIMRECKIPIDYKKMTCHYCGEKGHLSAKYCAPEAAKRKEEGVDKGMGDENTDHDSGAGNGGAAAAGDEWMSGAPAQPAVTTGGW